MKAPGEARPFAPMIANTMLTMIAIPNRKPWAKPQPIEPNSHSPRNSSRRCKACAKVMRPNEERNACLTREHGDLAEDVVDLGLEQVDVGASQPHEGVLRAAELLHQDAVSSGAGGPARAAGGGVASGGNVRWI